MKLLITFLVSLIALSPAIFGMEQEKLSFVPVILSAQLAARIEGTPRTPFEEKTIEDDALTMVDEDETSYDLEMIAQEIEKELERGNKRAAQELSDGLQAKRAKIDKSGICDQCNKQVKDIYHHNWYKHGKGSRLVACTHQGCNAEVAAYNLKQHINNVHGKGADRVACPECNAEVAAYNLKYHINNIHGEGSDRVACPECNAEVVAYTLKQHIKNVHGEEKELVACSHPACGQLIQKVSLERHMKTHAMDKQDFWICKECKQEFTNDKSLKNHLAKEHNFKAPWKPHYSKETRNV